MIRLLCFLVGFGLSIIGFMYIIAYLNYLTIGYSFKNYLGLIIRKPECLLAFIGFMLVFIAIFKKGRNYDICV